MMISELNHAKNRSSVAFYRGIVCTVLPKLGTVFLPDHFLDFFTGESSKKKFSVKLGKTAVKYNLGRRTWWVAVMSRLV
jgi:hypothetical protein